MQMVMRQEAELDQAHLEQLQALRQWKEDDQWLLSIVDRVLSGKDSGDEQTAVVFDRALATSGEL